MSTSNITTDHGEIKKWVEARGGFPAAVTRTESEDDLGVLRIDFPGYSGEDSLERVEWEDWFDTFEAKELAFLHQDKTADGAVSRFNKLVSRNSTSEKSER